MTKHKTSKPVRGQAFGKASGEMRAFFHGFFAGVLTGFRSWLLLRFAMDFCQAL
jgi:hypothetical protein